VLSVVGVIVRVGIMGSDSCSLELIKGKLNPGIKPVNPIMRMATKTAANGIQINFFGMVLETNLFD